MMARKLSHFVYLLLIAIQPIYALHTTHRAKTPITINQLFKSGNGVQSLSGIGAKMSVDIADPSLQTIGYTQILFYGTAMGAYACNTSSVISAAYVATGSFQFPQSGSNTLTLDANALYQLANNANVATTARCMQIAIQDNNANPGYVTNPSAACSQFELSCTASQCFATNSAPLLMSYLAYTAGGSKCTGWSVQTMLHAFVGGADGSHSYAPLLSDGSGNFYGTTHDGGNGSGLIFQINTSGVESVVYYLLGGTSDDGANPFAGLIQDTTNSNLLYGTTDAGGTNGAGTVFKIDLGGSPLETVLYSFGTNGGNDGINPDAGLMQDASNSNFLYGTTVNGGTNNRGTVFKIDLSGPTESVLYSFGTNGANDGAHPSASLIQDTTQRNLLYGTTYNGGGTNNVGTVFQIDLTGPTPTESVLYSFGTNGGSDGAHPYANLLQDTAHTNLLYGTTYAGGTNTVGTVFQIDLSGPTESVLYSFGTNLNDGTSPYAALIQDPTNTNLLYGTTVNGGGISSQGAVVAIDLSSTPATETVVYAFGSNGWSDGKAPYASLLEDSHGNLYGTTYAGNNANGTVFTINPPFPGGPIFNQHAK